jgi:hypothetical protein
LNSLYVPPRVRWNWGGKPVARTHLRTATAAGLALGLGLLAMSPAAAATNYQAAATAAYLAVANNGNGTGTVTATYDGSKETKTGDTAPPISILKQQDLLNAGVLAQEATAQPGLSAACAGLAGAGGSVAEVGDSKCLTSGTGKLNATLEALDLSKLLVADPASALGQINDPTNAIRDALAPVLNQVSSALQEQFGNIGVQAEFGAIQGRCTAGDSGPTGDSDFTDVRLVATLPKQPPMVLLDFDPTYPKNTHLTTNLSDVLDAILAALEKNFDTALGGQASQVKLLLQPLRDQLVPQIKANLEKNLAPIEAQLLDVTLNQQERPTPDSIKVRALDLQLLPAAKAQVKDALVHLQIGDAACAPVASAVVDAPQAATPVVSPPKAATPTGVSSGLATMPGSHDHGIDASTWALLALAGLGLAGSAWVGMRRVLG